jgi:MFS family permease
LWEFPRPINVEGSEPPSTEKRLLTSLLAYLKLRGYGDLEIGLFVTAQAAVSLIVRPLAGRTAYARPCFVTALGFLIISASFFAAYLFEVPPLLYVASLIFGLGVGIFIPSSQTLALAKAPTKSRGFLSSVYTMGMDVGNLSGPTMFGTLIERTNSYQVVFLTAPLLRPSRQ